MFPEKFINDAKNNYVTHNAVYFKTDASNEVVVSSIQEMGIKDFLEQKKIIYGKPEYVSNAGCCSFTKDSSNWYLFPIHKNELASVGLVEEDLIEWITFLNKTNAGFEYLYFGEQDTGSPRWKNGSRIPTDTFYWVGVPAFKGYRRNKSYLHWVSLRYLINGTVSGILNQKLTGLRLAYYNIPRIAIFLYKNFNTTRLRAFLYAHIACPFYSDHGIVYSDYMGYKDSEVDYSNMAAPCVSLKAAQFKALLEIDNIHGRGLNLMLTQKTYKNIAEVRKIPDLLHLQAPYDVKLLHTLFKEGKYKEFIHHISSSYKELNNKLKAELNVEKTAI